MLRGTQLINNGNNWAYVEQLRKWGTSVRLCSEELHAHAEKPGTGVVPMVGVVQAEPMVESAWFERLSA